MPARLFCCAVQRALRFAACRCMTMNTGLSRIELTGLPGPSGGANNTATKFFRSGFVWLPAVLIAGFGAWMLLSGYSSKPAESEPVHRSTAAVTEPEPAPSPAAVVAQDGSSFDPATLPLEAIAPVEAAPIDGLKISSQSWRRGGLGSKALVTFTLRNGNDYAVKDIEISCAFNRRDGSHLTDRNRMIHDTVNMKSRRTFARMHVGFVNINADQAKCALVAASRV
jgi:hypothetical protein